MIPEVFSVRDKVTIVTGGGTGIGKAIAVRFAEAGAPVAIASRKLENLEAVARQISDAGGQALALQCDVRDPEDVKRVVDVTIERFGRLDVLVNNHGASFMAPVSQITPNGWDAIVAINLKGTFLFSQAAAEVMKEQGGGVIVNISSTAGTNGAPTMSHYGAAKAGVVNFTTSFAVEVAPAGIRVNCVVPGPIVTEGFLEVLRARGEVPEDLGAGRVMSRWGEVDEIAWPVMFMASDASSFMTGQSIIVDGGGSTAGLG
jgi:NAD(P)-dependent dehydrogenase (short-subunit alcohol dehydrogenase family)